MPRFGGIPVEEVAQPRFGGAPVEAAHVPGQFREVGTAAPMVQVSPPEKIRGYSDIFTGGERIAESPELGTLPEFGATQEGDVPRIAASMLTTFDPKAQMEMIQSAIPEASFETTEDGSVIIEVPKEGGGTRRSVLNKPGFSPQDMTTAAAQILAFVPAAKLASLGKTLAQKVGLGAVGAGATEQALQEAGIAAGRQERDPTATALSAVLGGGAELVMPAIQGFRQARQARAIGAEGEDLAQVASTVRGAQEASEATGVPLFKAQQTGIPAQLERQSFVAQLPAGTRAAMAGLKQQNKAAGDAVESFMNSIAPPEAVITGAEKLRTAAQHAVEKAKVIRSEKASPLYKQAFDDGAQVNLKPVTESIARRLEDLPETGEISKSLRRAMSLMKGAKGKAPSLKQLHNAKLEIDQMINRPGVDSIGNTTKRELRDIQSMLLGQIDEASPAYAEARKAFEAASPDVMKMQDSIIGKIAELDDTQLKQISGKIFDPSQTNPQVVAQARKAITDIDPDAWAQITRVELEKRLGSIKSTAEAGTVENIPGQLYRALFPNDKSTKVLLNSLTPEAKKNITYLKTALGRARLGRPGGSQTAAREEIKQELRGGLAQSVRNIFASPMKAIAATGEDAAFNKRAAALAKAMYDPTWKAEMAKIRKLDPNTPAAGRAMTQLLNDIGKTETQEQQ